MAVKCGSSPQPAAIVPNVAFWTAYKLVSDLPFARLPALPAKLRTKAGLAEPKHHGSEVRIGPAASSPYCQTLLSLNCLETSLRPSIRPPSCTAGEAPCQRTVSQSQNTMAVKYGSGPRPAAHTAKRCFLNCLETSLRPSIRPPSCTASKAPLKGRSRRAKTPWQWSADRARGRQPILPNVAFWTA